MLIEVSIASEVMHVPVDAAALSVATGTMGTGSPLVFMESNELIRWDFIK